MENGGAKDKKYKNYIQTKLTVQMDGVNINTDYQTMTTSKKYQDMQI